MKRFTDLPDTTFVGPAYTGEPTHGSLPTDLLALLRARNGFVAFRGGLHVRGIVPEPSWHSLFDAWVGPRAVSHLFDQVSPSDVPFAEDCLGDQFILRAGAVYRLSAETGEVERLEADLASFLRRVAKDGWNYLRLQPLLEFERQGGRLEPGQLLSAFPPFCMTESSTGVSLRAVPVFDRLSFLANFARQVADRPDGAELRFRVEGS